MAHHPLLLAAGCALALAGCTDDAPITPVTSANGAGSAITLADLGGQLFRDTTLSSRGTQSCASCHDPATAFVDPDAMRPVSAGAEAGRFGTRNSPTAMYASFVPPLHLDGAGGPPRWAGGLFHDGRADTLEAQAALPLFNPAEMNLADDADLLARLRESPVRVAYEDVYGPASLSEGADPATATTRVAAAIAAFEREPALQPFSSKFDAVAAGTAAFTPQEARGRDLFVRADKGDCARCHTIAPGPGGAAPLFTNFTYENLGVPRHPDRAFFAADSVDTGLAATLAARGETAAAVADARGRFRVPTLRNVALTGPWMHNGVFTDLRTLVEFYNTRDSDPARWRAIGEAEVPETVNHGVTGNLGLAPDEVDAIVAFLGTLSDGYVAN